MRPVASPGPLIGMPRRRHSASALRLGATLALVAAGPGAAASDASSWRSSFDKSYDAIVVGSGPSESLLSSLLAANGKTVLQLEPGRAPGGVAASMDLHQMYARMGAPGAKPEAKLKLGASEEYSADIAPKVLMAGGKELQMLVSSGLWQQMDFRRIHRSFIYRTKPGGDWDVHRVLVTSEDVLKTRSIPNLEKPKVALMLTWLERFDESNPTTYTAGQLQKKRLNLAKMSAASFFRYWDLAPDTTLLMACGLGSWSGPLSGLKRLSAMEMVRAMKRYKESFKTFQYMTSPYVYPTTGIGATFAKASARVLAANNGASLIGRPIDSIMYDASGRACGVTSEGVSVTAGCVVAGPQYVPEAAEESYQVVRMYAVLAHAPHKCKDARSCRLLIPGSQVGRKHDIHLICSGSAHRIAPGDKWLAVLSTRVDGPTDGLSSLQVRMGSPRRGSGDEQRGPHSGDDARRSHRAARTHGPALSAVRTPCAHLSGLRSDDYTYTLPAETGSSKLRRSTHRTILK